MSYLRNRHVAIWIVIAIGVALLVFVKPVGAATENCVTIFENSIGGHDYWEKCGYGTANYNANLTGDIAGLSGTPLCNTKWWPAAGNDWNDCVSAVSFSSPAGYCAFFYKDANYSGTVIARMYATEGFLSLSGASSDVISSWRVVATSC